MRVRPARPDDMASVAEMARALAVHLQDPDPGDGRAALIGNVFGPDRWCECLVAEADGVLVGFLLACRRYEASMGQRSLWISDLYVVPGARGTGAGRALLRAIAERAIDLRCAHLCWDVWQENAGALAFYARIGGRIDKEIVPMVMSPEQFMAAASSIAEGRNMQTIGLIGGMSWESSAQYYRIINQEVRARLGGVHSARSLMLSVDFGEIERLQHAGDWAALTVQMIDAARRLERGGADFFLLCTNTMHRMADDVAANVSIPLLHIADPTAETIKAAGYRRVGLLGTAFTMEQDFYKGRLAGKFGLEVLVPDEADRLVVHEVIYRELVVGEVVAASRAAYRDIIARLVARGAQAIILGCTEIMLLVQPEDSAVPLFDTTTLHAQAAVARALA